MKINTTARHDMDPRRVLITDRDAFADDFDGLDVSENLEGLPMIFKSAIPRRRVRS